MSRLIELNSRRRRIAWRRVLRTAPAAVQDTPSTASGMSQTPEQIKRRLRDRGYDMATTHPPGRDLMIKVRAGLLLQGLTLTEWGRRNGYHHGAIRQAVYGTWNGPKGRALRERIVKAAGLTAKAAA